jgi:hypothetical protein
MPVTALRRLAGHIGRLRLPRWIVEAGAVLVALGVVAILLELLYHSKNLATRGGHPVFGDYLAFWSAGRTVLDGHVELVHDRATQWAQHLKAVPDIRAYFAFNSPPTLLLFTPVIALAPFPVSASIFLVLSIAIYIFAALKILPDRRALIFALTAPAAVYHIGSVQIALVIASASALALYWMDRRPRAAGAMIAVLAIKPHLAILWPVLLAITGRWRAFFAAAIATTAFAAAAAVAFGVEAYVRWFSSLRSSADQIIQQRILTPSYASLYANLLQMRAPQALAAGAQAISACAAIGLAVIVFRRGDARAQAAALCAATLLISPYLFFYDFVLLAAGAAFLGAPRKRLEALALALAWGAGLSLTLGYFMAPLPPLPLCPVAAWTVLIAALKRSESAALPAAPAQPM